MTVFFSVIYTRCSIMVDNMFFWGNKFQMFRIGTPSILAFVVNVKALLDRAYKIFIGESVSIFCNAFIKKFSITNTTDSSFPLPAIIRIYFTLRQEIIYCWSIFSPHILYYRLVTDIYQGVS